MEIGDIRVLHLTNNLDIGGVQKVIYQLCKIQNKKFDKIIVASTGGIYENRIKELGIEHHKINDLSDIKKSLNNYFILKKIIRDNHINVIHCHHRMAVFYAKLLGSNIDIIYNNHTIYSDKRLFSHILLRKNVFIIADGIKAKENVINFFKIPGTKVTVIPNAVEDFDGKVEEIPEIKKSKSEGNFVVMNASRLHPQKGLQYFLAAAKLIVSKYDDVEFFLVGDGPLKKDIYIYIEKNDLKNKIHLLGFRKDIKSTIFQCDVLVLSSIYEGLPLTPMEAFSVSKAVIGSNIDGTNEVIENQYNGLLFENKNYQDLASCIENVYKNRELLQKLNSNAYITYKEKFGIEAFSKKYLEFYSNI